MVGLLLGAAAALSGCGKAAPPLGTSAREIGVVSASALPPRLDGLRVSPESILPKLKGSSDTYAKAVGFFSLRQGKLVQATLEVVQLIKKAPTSNDFRVSLVNQISGGIPTELDLSNHDVYLATGVGSGTSIWFDGSSLFVLSTRSQFTTPRALLEAALAVHVS